MTARPVLVVGESLVDVVHRADGSRAALPGGSPLNVAVGLGRAGLPVRFVTALGDDPHGDLLRRHLATSHVAVEAHRLARTSVAAARVDDRGAAEYDLDVAWELGSIGADGSPAWLHVGSLGVTQAPGAARVAALLETLAGQVPVSYDPNCRPGVMGRPEDVLPVVERTVSRSGVVKLSEDDAAWLAPGVPGKELAGRWLALGAAVVVLTRGADGATAWTSRHEVSAAAEPGGPVVDTVGAGDAFMSGLVAALLGHDLGQLGRETLASALVAAGRVARRTCERPGADPPWADEP